MGSTSCVDGEKPLPLAENFIAQLDFAWHDRACCGKGHPESYSVGESVYGLISGPLGITDGYLYASDKAVAWLSNNKVLESWLNGYGKDGDAVCCDVESLAKCMCNVAGIAHISAPQGQFQLVAVDSPKAVSPRWTDPDFHEALAQSYSWVFGSVKLAPRWKSVEDLKQNCRPPAGAWKALQKFNDDAGPGLEAYKAIMAVATYGEQMREVKCSPEVTEDGAGGCQCLGRHEGVPDVPYCETGTDVALFCGAGGVESCDPSPFLCPAAGLPVGHVRAYLHKFLDAIPFFRGTGFSDPDDSSPEFIMPNTKASGGSPGPHVVTTDKAALYTSVCA